MIMEKEERTMVTLTLPFIELPEDKYPWDADAYNELGVFIVKDNSGVFHIVDVCGKTASLPTATLPPSVCNSIVVQQERSRPESLLNKIQQHIDDRQKDILDLLLKAQDFRESMRDEILENINSVCDRTREDLVEICNINTSPVQSVKGCISEGALLQLIKEIKK